MPQLPWAPHPAALTRVPPSPTNSVGEGVHCRDGSVRIARRSGRRPPSPALPPQTARGKGASRVRQASRSASVIQRPRRTEPARTPSHAGRRIQPRTRTSPDAAAVTSAAASTSSRRLKPQLASHEVRLRGLHAQFSASSPPKRGSGLPLPCEAYPLPTSLYRARNAQNQGDSRGLALICVHSGDGAARIPVRRRHTLLRRRRV
jgi:hypothetical protein